HIFSNNSQGPANIRYVTIDSIRVHKGARHGVVAEYFPDPALSDHGLSITNSTFDTLAANAVFVLGQATSRFKGVKVERNTARGISTNGRFFVGQFADGLLLRNNQATMQGGVLDIIEGANPRLEYNTTTSLSGFGYYFHPVTGTATLTGNRIVVQTGTGRTVKYLTTTAGSTATLITNNITGGSGTEYGTGVKVINQ
ncbi:MAG TPA: right-handed parallel beta-helix repeat-containing protein, partial [Chitinophagaceae bacterium]|nr:right-handed parallel beta-helix repeat-containing protein [Chitinophagaceae bacterium]